MPKKLINIRLDEDLWKQAKLEAVRQGKTLQEYVTERLAIKPCEAAKSNSDGIGAKVDRLSIPGVSRGVVRAVPKPIKRNGAKSVKVPMTGAEYQLDKDGTSGGRP